MTMTFRIRTAVTVGAILALAAAPAFAQSIDLRLATGTPPSHVWTKAAQHFADGISEATEGAVTVAIFPASQLGPESDLLQQMTVGVLDMAIVSAAANSARTPAFAAWFAPFTINDVAATIEISKSATAQEILDELAPQGILGLGYVFAGMRHILMAKDSVAGLEDLQGKKIRITPFPAAQVWWQAAGAVPTPVQLGDVYQALSSGLLDGVDIDLDALVGFSMQDVAEYLIVTNHMAFPGVAMITESAWGRMSEEQQVTFTTVMDETLAWAAEQQIAAEAANLALLENEMTVIRLDGAEAIFSVSKDAYTEAFKNVPLVAQFQNEMMSQ